MSPDPITLAAVASIASGVIGGTSMIAQGNAARASADYQAQLYERDAVVASQDAQFREDRLLEDRRRRIGAIRAASANSGVQVSGSVAEVLGETAEDIELEILAVRYGGAEAVTRARAAAASSRWEGRQAQQAGYLSGGASILGGAGEGYFMLDGAGAFDSGLPSYPVSPSTKTGGAL
jgi:hypothetical protein